MIRILIGLLVVCFLSVTSLPALSEIPAQWIDAKYCGKPKRDTNGEIVRSTTAIKYFKLQNPCPSTGLTFGPCSGWQINHTFPLVCGGCDHPSNLSWIPSILKAGAGELPIDRWEQKVYCRDRRELVPMPDPKEFTLEVIQK